MTSTDFMVTVPVFDRNAAAFTLDLLKRVSLSSAEALPFLVLTLSLERFIKDNDSSEGKTND